MNSSSHPTIWSFDLGKASIGEAVRDTKTNEFLHKASLLIPAEFASTKDAAVRRRMWRTRQAHKAREAWLDEVWRQAGLEPLLKREVWKNPETKKWELKHPADERLEREFPAKGVATCYTSCLLRIKLLRGEKLEPWQIYKALHSASQKRGYGRVPWAAREAKRGGKTEEEIEKEMAKKDPEYREAVEAWPMFKQKFTESEFHHPCYYDAWKMGLWTPVQETLENRIDCTAESTRKVRFDRADVEKEISSLARQAALQLPSLHESFDKWKKEGWSLLDRNGEPAKTFPVAAADFGDFLVHGPAGEPLGGAENDFAAYLQFRIERGIHPGSADDWMGATSQKTPRFDNRIVNNCALISRLQVCTVAVRFDQKTKKPYPDSLLAAEVTFLMKLKNTLLSDGPIQRKLTPAELQKIFGVISKEAAEVKSDDKNAEKKVTERYAITKSDWGKTKGIKELELRPVAGQEEIKSPKVEGRSRFSRPALRLVRALILSGQKPSEFRQRLLNRDEKLLSEIGMDVLEQEPVRPVNPAGCKKEKLTKRKPHVLVADLKFLADLTRINDKGKGDTWEDLYFPEQRLDALEARHSDEAGQVDFINAVRELLGTINDPVVRHRLEVFAERITEHHASYGVPEEVVLEFVREDFMGETAKRDLQKFNSEREKSRKEAKEMAANLGVGERSGQLKYELFKQQGSECPYCQQTFYETNLSDYRIEHIVPRKQGGPDAMINYVLAHETCNNDKGEQTPFQWKNGREGWNAYESWVKRHATALRNKKVQLLLREDAAELVQRYTALAETAWISKLAQKIVSLRFGWRNGTDKKGVKRVTVISGGLTSRIRRKYRLNSLLAPITEKFITDSLEKAFIRKGSPLTLVEDAQVRKEAVFEWESVAEKNRSDDRHHALDAMVINFWNTGEKKQDTNYFNFPDPIQRNAKAYFERQIGAVMPFNFAYEKAPLAETIYGGRNDKEGAVIVQRVGLVDLAMKPDGPSKVKFDPAYLRKNIKSVRDRRIANLLLGFLETEPDTESSWRNWCDKLRLTQRNGSPGPRVLKMNVTAGSQEEFAEMSKDRAGAYRKGKKGHKGQIIYLETKTDKKRIQKEVVQVRPVYAHQSRQMVEKALKAELGDAIRIYGFYQSGCLIKVLGEVVHKTTPLPAGTYLLNTIMAGPKYAKLSLQDGRTYPDIPMYPISSLITAGLLRAD